MPKIPKPSSRGFGLIELMIALSFSTLILLLLFHLFVSTKNTYLKQRVFADMEDRMRFMSFYLSQQIHRAGDWSCESQAPASPGASVHVYGAAAALHHFGLTIEAGSNVLQLQECVRLHSVLQFLPVLFFVADTHRVSHQGKIINALFFKIVGHPREELISGVSDFSVKRIPASFKNDHEMVLINYVLTSIDDVLKKPRAYWFLGKYTVPDDLAFYQMGVLCIVKYADLS